MLDFLLILLAVVWFGGAAASAFRQARYFQIEEYMGVRFIRWLAAQRDRWLPRRPVTAWLIGSILAFALAESPGSGLPALMLTAAAAVAVIPPRAGEVKKPFRATSRARRLLGATFILIGTAGLLALLFTVTLPDRFRPLALAALGFLTFLSAPLFLALGNLVMMPVESAMRRRFVQRARQALAAVNPTVIGITGSYGKTTTKMTLAHILNGRFRAYPTPKSYNTLMGVCIAINNDLAHDNSVDYFIAEMGAYVRGEIEQICDLTHPRIGIVVEVGPQHLERFGTLENIAAAKYEIIKALPADGVGVFNWDNPHIRTMAARGYPQTCLTVSRTVDPQAIADATPRFVASSIRETLQGLSFTVTDTLTGAREDFATPLLGEHNVTNILLAAAVAVHEGMPLREVAFRARSLKPAESRLVRSISPEGITIINDAYSANPVGIVYALRVLSLHDAGKRLLITPGMVELGALMDQENRQLGELAARHATDVILVGEARTAPIKEGLLAANFASDRLHVVRTLSEAVEWYKRNLSPGDAVLFLNDLPDTYSS
ncbi:MAG: UDP-N-acetylmuramoyl-tripeptide--D-alanyl-D-alanine ligase [Anaerolineae bacterium]|nr:UDP-N-acetylmuramoyl-tripeptide--D-alanyl-D-alanine ligase [Anaerolineae bacterium]NUQ02303.1 UDP-N-acetylmuramoyl-tripeptide--D-alanyl-D-alanine ligase [Anaerolineae bacterium]